MGANVKGYAMRALLLLIVAIALTIIFFVPLLLIQTYRRRKDLRVYYFNLAKSIDYTWAALLYGTDGHTVSAITHKKNDRWHEEYQEPIIDFVFDEEDHCRDSYNYEFITKPHLTIRAV